MKKFPIFVYLFPFFGLLALVGSVLLTVSTFRFLDKAIEGEGVVIDLEYRRSSDSSSYYPRVEFLTANDEKIQFTSSNGSNPPSFSVGEQVGVLYLLENPQEAKINTFFSLWFGPMFIFIFGLIFFSVGVLFIKAQRDHSKKMKFLQEHGETVLAKFQSVERVVHRRSNTHRHSRASIRVNRSRSTYKICAQWQNPQTQEIHVFESEPIKYDPSDYLEDIEIPVLIDPNDPSRYFMDTDFLPKMAG